MLKKIATVFLALAMVLGLTAGAMAESNPPASLTNGEVGGFETPDTPVNQSKSIKIAKEITAYNVDEEIIKAPTISYQYTIAAGAADKSITDAKDDHDPEGSVTRTTFAGIIEDIKLSNNGVVAWTTDDELKALPNGAQNLKYLTIDFSDVVFEKPGVYRYVINEALVQGTTYAQSGVTENIVETNPVTHTHTRYLDVYVKTSDSFTDGKKSSDWDIYGYVCMIDNEDITAEGQNPDTNTSGVTKTNGFVSATNDDVETGADSYYTFNVTVSKTLTGDAFSNNHKFPVHIDYTNAAVTNNILLIAEATENKTTDYAHNPAAVNSLDGLAKIADGGSIKYIGIPCGTTVTAYETNDVTGTTYEATITVDGGTPGTTKTIIDTTTPTEFAVYAEQAYNSLTGVVETTANQKDTAEAGKHTIAIANEFSVISPTGVVVRVAPYALILVAGIALLLISRRRKGAAKEE